MNRLALSLLLLAGNISLTAQQAAYIEVRVERSRDLRADTFWYQVELASDEEMQMRESQLDHGRPLRVLSWAELQAMADAQSAALETAQVPKSYQLPRIPSRAENSAELGIFRFASLQKLEAFYALIQSYDNVKAHLLRLSLAGKREEAGRAALLAEAAAEAEARARSIAKALGRSLGALLSVTEEPVPTPAPLASSWTFYPPLSALPGQGAEHSKPLQVSLRFRYELR